MTISFTTTREESALIAGIVDRARDMGLAVDTQTLSMDLTACHANGNPLDLVRLLREFPAFDFSHDIVGITEHINRATGKLENCFVPRCTARQSDARAYAESLIARAKSVD